MKAKQSAFLSMSAVARIRGERGRAELTQSLDSLRVATDEVTRVRHRLDELSAAKHAWVIETSGRAGRLEVRSIEMRERLDWLDSLIAAEAKKTLALEEEVAALSERCRLQRRLILKHCELDTVLRRKSVTIGRQLERASDEEDADDQAVGARWRGKRP
ncbi:hypothetical protein [Burkholderia ubonensis]|uniref:hypothetical protein n=1 Tax=Burkholderia ubonensis TaxID=101571 RepID=UPI0012FAC561|nr:hypothetical protein [Burkholderia ubonensis]